MWMVFVQEAECTRLLCGPKRLLNMSDLTLRTMIRPLAVCVAEHAPTAESFGRWRADELFSMLDEYSQATLQRVETEADAQFIIELIATPTEGVTSVLMRESIVVMTAERITGTDDVTKWEALASRFAAMIDVAAECYAAPVPV